jgi:hypothetical protein
MFAPAGRAWTAHRAIRKQLVQSLRPTHFIEIDRSLVAIGNEVRCRMMLANCAGEPSER